MNQTQTGQKTALPTDALFTEYINTCNTAISRHRDEFPFKQLIDAGTKLAGDKTMAVGIYKNDASAPFDYYTVRLGPDGMLKIVDHGKKNPDLQWKASTAYLEKVVQDPNDYIEHPARLDFDWLKSRVGLS